MIGKSTFGIEEGRPEKAIGLPDPRRAQARGIGEASPVGRTAEAILLGSEVVVKNKLAAVPNARLPRLLALFDEIEAGAVSLTSGEALEVISRAARVSAVLGARYASLVAVEALPAAPSVDSLDPGLLDVAAAGKLLGVSRSTVIRLTKAGKLRAVRPSPGVVRYAREDVEALS